MAMDIVSNGPLGRETENGEEEESAVYEKSLSDMLNELRRLYTNAVMSGSKDRIGFETVVNNLEAYNIELEALFSSRVQNLRSDLVVLNKERDSKIREWVSRYDKLQDRWKECMDHITILQEEKEDLRQQRDMLMMSHKHKDNTATHETVSAVATDSKISQLSFFKKMMENVLFGVTEALAADRGSIFIFHSPSKELRSLCLVSTSNEKMVKEIRINSRKGIVGKSFTGGEALNIANAYQDNRFYKSIDMETGYVTNSILCYPLYSLQTDAAIGVIQMINKRGDAQCFTVEDEARMSEYSYMIGAMLDNTKDLLQFGSGGSVARNNVHDENRSTSGNGYSETMDSFGDSQTTYSGFRKTGHMNVKRIGHSRGSNADNVQNLVGRKPTALIPKDIEEYIRKLEQCWRNAVKDCAFLHNVKVQLELEKNNAQNRVFTLEKTAEELEEKLASFRQMNMRMNKQHKIQQMESIERENQLRLELSKYQQMREEIEAQKQMYENNNLTQLLMNYTMNDGNKNNSSNRTKELRMISENLKKLSTNNNDSHDQKPLKETGLHLPSLNERNPSQHLRIDIEKVGHTSSESFVTPREPTSQRRQYPQKDIYIEAFNNAPAAMCIVTKSYRIWRVNTRLCELLECEEENLLGRHVGDICVMDQGALPRLFQFDVIQGLGVHAPARENVRSSMQSNGPERVIPIAGETNPGQGPTSVSTVRTSPPSDHVVYRTPSKPFVKVNLHISSVGDVRQRLTSKNSTLPAPVYVLIFNRQSDPTQHSPKHR